MRRRIKTSEDVRKKFPGGLQVVRAHFGFRVVCSRCANRLDLEAMKIDLTELLKIGAILIILLIALLIHGG
jgi:hypothetical protein